MADAYKLGERNALAACYEVLGFGPKAMDFIYARFKELETLMFECLAKGEDWDGYQPKKQKKKANEKATPSKTSSPSSNLRRGVQHGVRNGRKGHSPSGRKRV